MIQHYHQMMAKINSFQGSFMGPPRSGQIQKIFSTSRYICFGVRYPGRNAFLYVGRGGGYEGFWFSEAPPPSSLRKRDFFLEHLRGSLDGRLLKNIRIDLNDRIVVFDFIRSRHACMVAFFWAGRRLYFINSSWDDKKDERTIFLSWRGHLSREEIDVVGEDVLSCFDEAGRRRTPFPPDERERVMVEIPELLEDEIKAMGSSPGIKRGEKSLLKKIEKIEADLQRGNSWAEVRSLALAGKLDLEDASEFHHQSAKIKFPKSWGHYKKLDLIFEKIKRWKAAEKLLKKRLETTREEVRKRRENPALAEESTSGPSPLKPVWYTDKQAKRPEPRKSSTEAGYEIFLLSRKYKVGVGKTAQGNDRLRKEWADKKDFWLHIEGGKGAHLIVKTEQIALLSEHEWSVMASLLADRSKLRSVTIPLIYTQVANLRGVSGVAGLVTYGREKRRCCAYIENWVDFIAGF
jgi:predicted ribosome quality control (RQC) complex YloA/Tae2 family protein